MAREILFKAKRLDNGKWVMGGSIIQFLDDGVRSFYMPQFNEKCICEHDEVTDDILKFEDTRFYKVDGDTICQYTGLNDKNGKKIWENDAVRKSDINALGWPRERNCKVSFDKSGYWLLTTEYGDGYWIGEFESNQLEVIGNIFDSPDLLEEKHE